MSTRQILGDTLGRTIIKLVVVSLIVGAVMSVFGLAPMDVWWGLRDFAVGLWQSGWAALGRFGDWLILGASVVLPLFILARLLSFRAER